MKYIFLLFFALVIAATARAGQPWIFGNGEAVNLTNGTAFQNGVRNIAGALNPSATAVNAPSGSMYFSTSGTIYVKQDAGLSTNWLPLGIAAAGSLSTINGQSGPNISIATGSSGSDFNISASSNTISLNLPSASGSSRGLLTSADWTTFNGKEPAISSGTTSQFWRGDKTFVSLAKGDVGLSNVDNTSDANKPVSTAQQAALDLKENLIIATTSADYYRGDKTFQPLNKAAVGLGNVDNTSDANKPVSTAQQTALDLKVDGAVSSVDSEVMLYSGTSGKVSKRASGTGYAKLTSGVLSTSSTVAASDLTGQVALANGGTNKSLSAVNGGVVYTDTDSQEVTSAGTSGQVLQANGAAAPTWVNKSISGKAQNKTAITLEEIQVPNNQLTLVTGSKYLAETGNKNILDDASFEGSNVSGSWVLSGGSYVSDNTPIDGAFNALASMTGSSFTFSQDSTLYASQFADGVQGLASLRARTSVTSTPIYVCYRQAGTTASIASGCVQIQANGKWGLYKIPFILGATSNGIIVTSNGVAITGDVEIDDAFVGAVDLKQDINVVGPWQTFTPVGSWITNTTYTGKWRQVGENAEISLRVATAGAPTSAALTITLPNSWTIDSNKLTVLSDGLYMPVSDGLVSDSGSRSGSVKAIYKDSSTVYLMYDTGTGNTQGITQIAPFTFGSGDFVNVTFTVPISQFAGSSSVYTSQNGDYGPTLYTPTLSSTTGVSANIAYHERRGEKLRINGYVSWSGTGGGSSFTVSVPSGLTINTAKLPSTAGLASRLGSGRWFDSGTTTHPENVEYTNSTSVNFRADDSTGAIPAGTGFGSGDFVAYYFEVPIVGWETSSVSVYSFKDMVGSQGSNSADIQSVYFGSGSDCETACTTGSCTICNQVGTKITTVSWTSTGVYRINGIDGTKYNCSGSSTGATNYQVMMHNRALSTSSYAQVVSASGATNADSRRNSVTCIGVP